MAYWRDGFRIQREIFEIPTQNPFLGEFWPKKSKLSFVSGKLTQMVS